jgi:hypothetical protein
MEFMRQTGPVIWGNRRVPEAGDRQNVYLQSRSNAETFCLVWTPNLRH